MNATLETLTCYHYFTDDVYVLDNLFVYPKNLVFTDDILDMFDKWEIDQVFSQGELKEIPHKEEGESKIDGSTGVINTNPDVEVEQAEEEIIDKEPYADTYKRWALMTIGFFKDILTSQSVNKEEVVNLIEQIKTKVGTHRNEAMMIISKPMEGIPSIYHKALDVTVLSLLLSNTLSLNDYATNNLLIGALFHDIGMLKISKDILQKKSALTPDEVQKVRSHTLLGYKYLKSVNYSALICSGALQHHERIDGKGYPNQCTSDKITDVAKVIAVADAYCAAIADKTFKESLHGKDAVQDLLGKGGTVYDPIVLKALVKTISFYPVGSLVQLSDNTPAKVVGTTSAAMRPIVRTILFEGTETKQGDIIDLSKTANLFIKGIYKK